MAIRASLSAEIQEALADLGLKLLQAADAEGPTISLEHSENLQFQLREMADKLLWLNYGP